MKKLSLFFVVLNVLVTVNNSCDTTETPPVVPPKDPRTYTWTIDTLINNPFQTDLIRIWGTSPNDVYVGGHNADFPGSLWHYDGKKWEDVSLPVTNFDAPGIYGFSSNDIWVVGETATDFSLILHFNGANWQNFSNPAGKALRCIWGSSPNNIWAGGTNILFHYDGSSWKQAPFFIPTQGIQLTSIAGLKESNIYMVGYRNDVIDPFDTSFYYLYHFNGNEWLVEDSSYITSNIDARKFGVILDAIGGEFYGAGDMLFKKTENNWRIINNDPLIFSLGGSSSNNIFCAGINGTVYHYNGVDWKKITINENFTEPIYDIWTEGNEAFFIAHDGARTYIIHGK